MKDLVDGDWEVLSTGVGIEAEGSGGVKIEGVTGGEDVLGVKVCCGRPRARY